MTEPTPTSLETTGGKPVVANANKATRGPSSGWPGGPVEDPVPGPAPRGLKGAQISVHAAAW